MSVAAAIIFVVTVLFWGLWSVLRPGQLGQGPSSLDDAWAWGSDDAATEALRCKVPNARAVQRAPAVALLVSSPLNAALLGLVLIYRRFFRVTTVAPICRFSPSCSSYALGMLRRHPAWVAVPQIVRRLRSCNGQRTGIDLSPHAEATEPATVWQAGV